MKVLNNYGKSNKTGIGWFMEKWSSRLEVFCTKAIFLISTGMFGCLTFWAAKYVQEFPADYSEERILGDYDSFWRNLLAFFIVLAVLFVVQKLLLSGPEVMQQRKLRLFVLADLVIVGLFAVNWVTGCHIEPYADQMQVYLTALEFRQGNFQDMKAYFYMCPQQYGLAFLYECILWIWESFQLIQYINILFLLMIYYFGYKTGEELSGNPRVGIHTLLVMNGFLPLFLYVNFVYGELCTIAMSLWAVWSVLRWLDAGKKRYGAMAVIGMMLAILSRKNMIIVSIALAIILVICGLRNKNWKAWLLAVLLFVLPLGGIEAVELSYEARSGLEVGRGIPTVLVVAMGMQQSWQGAGAYNAYNHTTFWEVDGDTERAAEIAMEYIDSRLEEFAADLPAARYFYQTKIWEQWNVGSMGSLFMTNHFEESPYPLAQSVYGGALQQKVLDWMNLYLFVIYLAVCFYSLWGLLKKKDIRSTILPLVAIGGMIFSLLWESKSRYVLPYVVMILPCVAAGINQCHFYLEKGFGKIVRRSGKA